MTALIAALDSLKSRADLAIAALRRGDHAAAVRELDIAADELREAVESEKAA